MTIWLCIKPNLKCTQFSKYKKEYEDQIALAEANIGEAMRQCDAVVSKHEALVAEKNELSGVLSSGGSAVQDIINKTERLEAAKGDVEKQVNDTNKRIKGEEELIDGINQSGTKVTADANRLRDTIKTLESNCEKSEDALEREKKSKGDVEKLKRKIEGDLKLTQEAVSDLDRIKADLAAGLQRKEKELMSMSAKIEDEGTLGSKYNKQVKELQSRIEELDEELHIERQNRA